MVATGRKSVLAFGRQTGGEGVPLASPKFELPMGGGSAGPQRSVEDLPWTDSGQDPLGAYVSYIGGVLDVSLPVLPKSSVPLLQAAMGTRTTTGAGDPYSHAETFADTLPFFTFFFHQPGDNYWTVPDLKVGDLELSGSPGKPLSLSIAGRGKKPTRSGSKWSAATVVETAEPFFTYIGAVLNLDIAATPAVTRVRNLRQFSIGVARNLDAIQTDDVSDQYIAEQLRETSLTLDDVVLENNDAINAINTGTTSGTTMSSQLVYGSIDFIFGLSDGTATSSRKLEAKSSKMRFAIDQIPQADPQAKVVAYTITGRAYKPASGSALEATVLNGDSGTNY